MIAIVHRLLGVDLVPLKRERGAVIAIVHRLLGVDLVPLEREREGQ